MKKDTIHVVRLEIYSTLQDNFYSGNAIYKQHLCIQIKYSKSCTSKALLAYLIQAMAD